ncbi:MAG: glycosyltransferase [Campylobacterota bacterium]|nr:glycosyltransferase [Campylobacterota bacterium]
MKNIKAIHQFTPTVAFGDSVSNGLIFTQKLLHSMGFESNIYICDLHVDRKFNHKVYNIAQYEQDKEQVLFYHHSIGHICHDKIMNFIDTKILVYHNITPSHFFKDEKHLQVACDEGREQLQDSVSSFISSLADSLYNANELRYYNYRSPVVLPLLLDLDKKVDIKANESLVERYSDSYNILFVGRVVQNKCQHQLIDTLMQLREKRVPNIKLFIVGGVSQPPYFEFLHRYAKNLGLSLHVIITKKVSDKDLAAYYKLADLYLSLSEHEGFGMPLIEAIKYDIPILAYNAGGVASTVVQDGLLEFKAPNLVADKIIELQNDPYFRVELLKKQKQHLQNFSNPNIKNELISYLSSLGIKPPIKTVPTSITTTKKTTYQIEGPFDSNYSLAIVNKDIALALNATDDADLKLYSTEGAGDFEPNFQNLDRDTEALATKNLKDIDISIRNLYPPRTNAMKGYQKIIGPYGWEESKFPQNFVDGFNTKLTMLFTMSDYVKDLLKDNGVYTPIVTTGIVVESILHVDSKPFSFEMPDGFKLLHISSAFPRKGLNLLLDIFDSLDDAKNISLIIKTFPNPHNNTVQRLEKLGFSMVKHYEKGISLYSKNSKNILLINKDIPQSQIRYLYENSDLLVAPSFGEGFGLPMAEAMLLNLPVLTTGYGGQSDFCRDETAWLLEFEFAYAKTHMHLENSLWAVPKSASLKEQIVYLCNLSDEELRQKTTKAKNYILQNYSAKKVAQNITETLSSYPSSKPKEKIALFSTYNTRCGIALYAHYLISSFKDEVTIFANHTDTAIVEDDKNIVRCWEDSRDTKNIEELKKQLLKNKIGRLIVQYNFSFIPLHLLAQLLEFCYEHSIGTYLFLHSTKDVTTPTYRDSFSTITTAMKKASRIYIHTLDDINYLKNFGIYKNTYLFAHGINYQVSQELHAEQNTTPVLATFGFLLPQKGVLELVDIVQELHKRGTKVKLLLLTSLHPAPVSKLLERKLKQKIKDSGISEYITLNTDFLQEQDIISQLSHADKILFLYKETQESSSAAIRMGLLAQKEVITSKSKIFDDLSSIITQTQDSTTDTAVNTILNSLKTPYDTKKHQEFLEKNSWQTISKKFRNSF